jgi:glycosyltransferase involved in cell wall biosynthesis
VRILYDGKIYSMQTAGGINRYFANLVSRLPASFCPTLLTPKLKGVNFPTHPNLKIYEYGRLPLKHISWKLGKFCSFFETRYVEAVSLSKSFNIVHPTYYSLLTRREINEYRVPVVITVHDMIHDLFPAHTVSAEQSVEEKRRAVTAADAVICVSENTRKDLLELYGISERKVSVIHHASELHAGLASGPEPVPSGPYYLYVGSRAGYKNFDRLLRAFANAFTARPDVTLCVVGSPFNDCEQKQIAELKLAERIEHYGHVRDEQLAKLYRYSIALVYPSLYEGFGIPPLEAMACGTVVIASNCSSIPEVVGDAGILLDPTSVDELTDALLFIADHPEERERLIAEGRLRAQLFDWDKTVAQTLDVYRSLQN